MEKDNNKPEQAFDEAWLDELLGIQQKPTELGVDEHAVNAAGLTKPEDLELEQIVNETLAENWEEEPEKEPEPIEEIDKTQQFVPVPEPIGEQEQEQEQEQEIAESEEAPKSRKVRPAWKKGYGLFGLPHVVSTAVWLVLVMAIGISLGRVAWLCAADLLAFGREPAEVMITITQDDDISSVAKKLHRAGLIRYPVLFETFANLTGKGEDISAGTFTLNAIYDYNAMINAMVDYGEPQNVVEIMFPEGYSCAQIFELLEQKNVCTVAELEAYAANGELGEYWFLEGVERGHKYCLEGFLAPDTYDFYTNDDPKRVLEKFLDEFDDRITDMLKQEYTELNEYLANKMRNNGYSSSYIAENQLSFRDVVIIASIVEKESASNRESYRIASVFYNRLTDQGKYPYLESDATIDYAINYYNKGELITDEQINASPYQSYTHKGLVPGPICNPGLNSLGAALSPEDTEFYFFLYKESEGEHVFSKSLEEHQQHLRELE